MSITITCRRCRRPIVAADEDDLVAQVQEHARDHGGAHGTHLPSREHILARHHDRPEPERPDKAGGTDAVVQP